MTTTHCIPVHIETVAVHAQQAQDVLTSRYDGVDDCESDANCDQRSAVPVGDTTEIHVNAGPAADVFQHVVVTDVDGNAPAHELRAAALRHVKEKGGGFIQVPHGERRCFHMELGDLSTLDGHGVSHSNAK